MMRYFLLIPALLCFLAAEASAGIKYYSDPVYQTLNSDDHHPMDDIKAMAEQGDVRAQFILGDLFSKGKGGYSQSVKEARRWFEESAMHGHGPSFIRLAVLAKREKNFREAWQWYSLAAEASEDEEKKFALAAREELVKENNLLREDVSEAKKSMSLWKDARDKRLEDEEKALRERERPKKEQEEKANKTDKEQTATLKKEDSKPEQSGVKYNE